MLRFNQLLIKYVTVPSSAYTAGTRFTVAHGLGYQPNLDAVFVQARGADNDTDQAQEFAVVKADATNVTLKPTRTTTASGRLAIFLDQDVGGGLNAAGV